ncbi:putative membrane protein [Synechococcus sp. WH 8103]|nr:putative membrane protein [Synechococcus sp. WH 8103]
MALKLQRLKAWLGGRRQRVSLTVAVYLLVWSMPLLVGQPVITVFALMPLLLVPPVGWLVYWLVWKEFHD